MIFSMTGFSSQQREVAGGVLSLELRTVNHRYLELQLRLDEALRAFETPIREAIAARLQRGKVECRVSFAARVDSGSVTEVNAAVLDQIALMSAAVERRFPQIRPMSVADILRWPGLLASREVDADALSPALSTLLQEALADLQEARAREGGKLAAVILERLAAIEGQLTKLRPLLPALLHAYQEKLAARLHDALQNVDEERLRQELTLFAQKIDVDEELSRLTVHLQEVRRILSAGGAVGKRLDFLMQELNREANTLGSKSASTEVSQLAMELKVLIEQMREQIQNIE